MIETAYVFRPNAGPGEANLAQGGVLFLDGLQDFPHATLTALRPALETGRAAVVRAGASIAHRACFQLLAAMEPCRPRKDRPGRVGSAFLDRIDLVVHVPQIEPTERARAPAGEASAEVVARVRQARACRRARSDEGHTATDARTAVEAGEPLPEARRLAEKAVERFRLSARDLARVLRVSRTIADLAGTPRVCRADVAEALAYRRHGPDRPHDRCAARSPGSTVAGKRSRSWPPRRMVRLIHGFMLKGLAALPVHWRRTVQCSPRLSGRCCGPAFSSTAHPGLAVMHIPCNEA